MRGAIAANWPAKLAVFAALAVLLHGFLTRIVDPLAAAMGATVSPAIVALAETVLIALYTLGLFAFPRQFWRRAFKLACLMAPYLLLGPLLASGLVALGLGGGAWLAAAAAVAGHLLALALGFVVYKLGWPRLASRAPRYNPAA